MKVRFELMAQARHFTGHDVVEMQLESGTSVETAVRQMAEQQPESARQLFCNESGSVRPSLMVIVNGQMVSTPREWLLADNDVVSLLTPLGGG